MTACSTNPGASTVAATVAIASPARSRLLILTFDIDQLPSPRNWAMAGGSNGYRAALVRRQITPGLISSLPGTAGLPPFISFSTSSPDHEAFQIWIDRGSMSKRHRGHLTNGEIKYAKEPTDVFGQECRLRLKRPPPNAARPCPPFKSSTAFRALAPAASFRDSFRE